MDKTMNAPAKHTPTPWTVQQTGAAPAHGYGGKATRGGYMIAGPAGARESIAHLANGSAERAANAEHIVRCVNAHDDLLAALRDIAETLRYEPNKRGADALRDKALAAIAKAES